MEYSFHEIISLLTDDESLVFVDNFGNRIEMADGELKFLTKIKENEYCYDFMVTDLIVTSKILHTKYKIYKYINPFDVLKAFTEGKTIELTKVNINTKELRNYKVNSGMNNFEFNLDDLKYGEWKIVEDK